MAEPVTESAESESAGLLPSSMTTDPSSSLHPGGMELSTGVQDPIRDDNDDPLAPRPVFEGGYECRSLFKYYTRRNIPAETEYEVVGNAISGLIRSLEYKSYFVGVTHVGYDYASSMPVLLVCAKEFSNHEYPQPSHRIYMQFHVSKDNRLDNFWFIQRRHPKS